MLNLFALFHLNLMYSSLEEANRPEVIRRCYHPLLDLAAKGLPLAVEAPSVTLKIIGDLDPSWLERLQSLIAQDKLVFVGSGYSQIIAPLVPAAVNARNLRLGQADYQRLLGIEPDIWMFNELVFSSGLVPLYHDLGAKAVIAEWNNASRHHPDWDRRLGRHRQRIMGADGSVMPVIWIDTIDFQQLQRLAHGATTETEFLAHWQAKNERDAQAGFAAVYGNDAEVFDFRPGRYQTEEPLDGGEWARLEQALRLLAAEPGFNLVPVTTVLAEPGHEFCDQPLQLTSAAQPVLVKKQEKYNLNRWALTGRGDLEANTACHRIAADLNRHKVQDPAAWRRLCRLWSSDLRTHITPKRWQNFLAATTAERAPGHPFVDETLSPLPRDRDQDQIPVQTDSVQIVADTRRGLALRSVTFPQISASPAVGTLIHGFFEDIALGADYYTGHCVIQQPGQPKSTDLRPCAHALRLGITADGRVVLNTTIKGHVWTLEKQFVLAPRTSSLELRGRLSVTKRDLGQVHPVHITIPPGFFDPSTLGYATANGGRHLEVFRLHDQPVDHGAPYSMFVTAKGGLGATDGRVIIGDRRRRIVIRHDPEMSALVPRLHFIPQPDGRNFLRLAYSAQEIDETFVPNTEPWQVSWVIRITADNQGLETL